VVELSPRKKDDEGMSTTPSTMEAIQGVLQEA